jgi:hypothetical protein
MTAQLKSWAAALSGEVSGNSVLAPGPGHSKRDRSLSVTPSATAPDGFLVHSFCGDDPIACKDYVRLKTGSPAFKPNKHAKPAKKTYFDYHDAHGAIVYQVERTDYCDGRKKFNQRRPDGNGGWLWNLGGVRPVPYRLPELIEAAGNGNLIVIAEGERKVDLLWSWNIPSTCNSGGAEKWRPEHSAYLSGADVVILPDNDQAGRLHLDAVAVSLSEVGASVRVLDLPGLPPKGDVIDWGAAGGTVEQLHALIENDARPWAPTEREPAADRGGGEPLPKGPDRRAQNARFELIPFDKIAFDTTPAYLVKGLIPRVGLCVFWGAPKCGKSFIVFDLMMHVALDWEYRGRRVQQGAVAYCAFEGQAGLRNRVEAFRQRKLAEGEAGIPFYLIADAMNLVADHPALIASVLAALGDTKPAAIALDTLNRSMPGSESSDEDMTAYVKAGDALRMAFNCAVVIVHHCGHEGTRPRGHSSLMGAVDAQIAVKRDAADNILTTVELMKDGPQGDEFTSRLEMIEIGIDDDGDKITSCVIIPVDGLAPQKEKPKKLPAAAANALKALHEIIDDAGTVPLHDPYIPPETKTVTIEQWRDHAFRRGISGSGEMKSKQQAFRRAFDQLAENHRIAVSEPYVWPL